MKNWKKQWKTELDAIIPSLDEKVLKEPIPQPEKVVSVNSSKKTAKVRRFVAGMISSCAVVALALVIGLSGIIPMGGTLGAGTGSANNDSTGNTSTDTGNNGSTDNGSNDNGNNGATNDNGGSNNNGGSTDGGEDVAPSVFKSALATVEINPTVTFVMDEDGVVTDVLAGNIDADVILSDSDALSSMKGKELKVAVKSLVEYATMLGYIDANGDGVMRISSTGDVADEWIDGAKIEVAGYFNQNNIKSALIVENVDYDTFKNRCKLGEFDKLDDLYDWAKGADELFIHREMRGKDDAEMVEYYKKSIVAGVVKEEIIDEIEDFLEDFNDLKIALEKMPNYWTKKDHPSPNEFELIEEINEILFDLNNEYGVQIKNADEYQALLNNLSALDVDAFIENVNTMISNGNIEVALTEIESSLGIKKFDDFTKIPTDPDDFIEHANNALSKHHGNRRQENEGKINDDREDFDYDDFMQDVFDEIENDFGGSIDDFFNHKGGNGINPPYPGAGNGGNGNNPGAGNSGEGHHPHDD